MNVVYESLIPYYLIYRGIGELKTLAIILVLKYLLVILDFIIVTLNSTVYNSIQIWIDIKKNNDVQSSPSHGNDVQDQWCYFVSPGHNELIPTVFYYKFSDR